MLNSTQLATLKADILADPVLNAFPNDGGGNTEIANRYNLLASPTWTVWKGFVSIRDIADQLDGAEFASVTSANHTRMQTFAQLYQGGVNPAILGMRQFLDDVLGSKPITLSRVGLNGSFWKRSATRAEKLFSTGTGSVASPATMTFEGLLTYPDIEAARNS